MKNSYITVTDQFCGAGGSSQGVRSLANKMQGGIEVKLALNHWKLAIETHSTNFQNTLHDCTDVSACDPRRYPSTDILITSPECTNHSVAKGQKAVKAQMDLFLSGKQDAAAERSRATMWDVCRFAEYHNYNAIIVENVVDARKWIMYDAWLNAMHILGYNHKAVYLNSMHCQPTPQSRDRMYVVFWKKGNKAPNLDYMPLAFSPRIGKDVQAIQSWKNPQKKFGKYRTQYVYCCPITGDIVEPYYHASFNIIDWSDLGARIGDRKKDLSPNTVERIESGLKKYGNTPLVLTTKYHSEKRENGSRSVCEPLRTQCGEQAHGILTPFLVDDKQTTGVDCRIRAVDKSINTVHSDPRVKLIVPMPFIIQKEHTKSKGYVKPMDECIQTQATRQTMGMVVPYIIEMNSTGECKPASNPTSTITAGGINHGIVSHEALNSFFTYYNNGTQTSHITEAVDVVPTRERISLITNIQPKIEDCYYRMLKPAEVKLAMAFDRDYVILGNGKEQVKQCGNAVTPPAMEWLVKQVVESFN
ncbi:MAG: DNA cytosine methyltransferase [Flavobacteriales bacterium]|nr:MAG: DNA cytosine methyltransferase [Flavobacteriales bacterium]